jgi:hypothetical protein
MMDLDTKYAKKDKNGNSKTNKADQSEKIQHYRYHIRQRLPCELHFTDQAYVYSYKPLLSEYSFSTLIISA